MSAYELKTSLVHLLHRASQTADELFTGAQGSDSLTPRQFAVLSAIAASDGLSQTQIVELTGVDRSTMADIVYRLKQKGLITRQRSKLDARAYSVRLSIAGRKMLVSGGRGARLTEERLDSFLATPDSGELKRLLQALLDATAKKKLRSSSL